MEARDRDLSLNLLHLVESLRFCFAAIVSITVFVHGCFIRVVRLIHSRLLTVSAIADRERVNECERERERE